MAKTYYDVLGLRRGCKQEEVRSAYRKLVLKYHPDRSSDPKSAEIFIELTQAYDVLSDPDKRRSYDRDLLLEAEARARPSQPQRPQQRVDEAPRPKPQPHPSKQTTVATELTRLTMLFNRGQYSDAESLARRIISLDGRQSVPYAVLGDLARNRGELKEASKMYAYAVQMDPRNTLYQQRYEELLSMKLAGSGESAKNGVPALWVGGGVTAVAGIYLALSKETAIFPSVSLISSWTLGLVVMTFLCGVVIGASLSVGEWLDRLSSSATSSLGRIAPPVALAIVAIVSFWAATGLYLVLGGTLKSFNLSTSRLIAGVAFAVVILSLAASVSSSLNAHQVFFWSGNLLYLGSLAGWFVSDAFRRA